jgi:hypothetical protein
MDKLIALHKHWCIADSLKQFIYAPIPGRTKQVEQLRMPEGLAQLGEMNSQFHRLQIWYALLYVVIEGYKELKLAHPDVDPLLTNEGMVDALRLFRNAIFHYQKQPINEKLLKFLEVEDSAHWIQQIDRALKAFFESALPINAMIEAVAETPAAREVRS